MNTFTSGFCNFNFFSSVKKSYTGSILSDSLLNKFRCRLISLLVPKREGYNLGMVDISYYLNQLLLVDILL